MERDERTGSLSGLTEPEAKEFHRLFMMSFWVFTLIAVGAHILVWAWRPWIPGVAGYQTGSLDNGVELAAMAARLFG